MVARAFRGRKSLETGTVRDSRGNRCGGKIKPSYVGRVLRLTLLAPDIVEAILDGRQPLAMALALMQPFLVGWGEQQIAIGFGLGTPRSD